MILLSVVRVNARTPDLPATRRPYLACPGGGAMMALPSRLPGPAARTILPRLAFVAVAALLAGAAHAALPAAVDDPWVEVRTARFRVFSNGGAAMASEAVQQLERLAESMAKTTGGLRVDGTREVR